MALAWMRRSLPGQGVRSVPAGAWLVRMGAAARAVAGSARVLLPGRARRSRPAEVDGEEQFRILFDRSPDVIVVADPEDGRILRVNRACERLLDRPADTVVGKTVFLFCSARGVEEMRTLFARSREQGAGSGLTTFARPDGSGVPVGATATAFPWGGSVALLLTFRDVSERMAAEEERARFEATLREVAAEWTRTFDTIPMGILVVAADGAIKRLNEAARALAGGTFTEIAGARLARLEGKEPWTTIGAAVDQVCREPTVFFRQVEDGSTGRTWNVTVSPMTRVEGRDPCVIVTAQEATQIVALQDALRRSERMAEIGTLVSGVAHEVRNPLFAISASIDTLEAELGESALPKETIELLRDGVKRLVSLMQDLLDYGRPSTRDRARDSLESVVYEATRQCHALARAAGVEIVTRCAGGVPPVDMDHARLARAVQNVIQNAVQHSARGGVVEVEVDPVPGEGREWVACAVRDHGPGFSPEDLRRAFEPLFSRRPGGTGLGLSIAQNVVEEHGGRVQLDNHPGGGARVSLRLPAAARGGSR